MKLIRATLPVGEGSLWIAAIFEWIGLIVLCDAMMHVLKDSINLKYSELLTKPICNSNLI